jgi:nucleotidyltransferase/DNA polymerase involved in DNA repair
VTYERDLCGRDAVAAEIDGLAAALMDDERDARAITHVAVKIRWATFFTRTKIVKLKTPTTDASRVRAGAAELLDRFAAAGFDLDRPIRLLGCAHPAPDADRAGRHAESRPVRGCTSWCSTITGIPPWRRTAIGAPNVRSST